VSAMDGIEGTAKQSYVHVVDKLCSFGVFWVTCKVPWQKRLTTG
jgi:hypothetical protein